MSTSTMAIDNFTKSGPKVTRVGLGGEGILRTHQRTAQAREVIQAAVRSGDYLF